MCSYQSRFTYDPPTVGNKGQREDFFELEYEEYELVLNLQDSYCNEPKLTNHHRM